MGDTALKIAQIALEGPYTSGSGASPSGNNSVYNAGTALSATRRLSIEKGIGADFKYAWDAPEEARGTYAGSYQHVLESIMATGKITALVYCDDLVYYGRMMISGSPTVTTLPSTPTTLLAATQTANTMPSLTTQPNATTDGALAKIIAVTLQDTAISTAATIVTLNGTDIYGNAQTEKLYFLQGTSTQSYTMSNSSPYSSTQYSVNYYATITSITCTVVTTGQQLLIQGINAFQWTFKNDMANSTLYSATGEYFDGTAAWQLPGMVMEKLGVQMQIGKSIKADASFNAKQKAQLLATSVSINPAAQSGTHDTLTNLLDSPSGAMSTYLTRLYADPIGTTPGTTQISARLIDYKIEVDSGAKLGKAADGTPYPSFVGRSYYKFSGDMTLLFNSYSGATTDPSDVLQFLNGNSRITRVVMPGPYLPCGPVTLAGSGWPSQITAGGSSAGQYGLMVDLAAKYTDMTEKDVDGRAAFQFKMAGEVDLVNLKATNQWIIISRISPNAY